MFPCNAIVIAQIEQLRSEALSAIADAADLPAVDAARVKFLGRSGSIPLLSERMREVPKEEKASIGKALNALRTDVSSAIEARLSDLRAQEESRALAEIDVSLPGIPAARGGIHPLTQLVDRAVCIFRRMGFSIADGPDIETEWHCFDALHTPADHPARNDQDTFYLPDGRLLRAHTSTIQIRTMEAPAAAHSHHRPRGCLPAG